MDLKSRRGFSESQMCCVIWRRTFSMGTVLLTDSCAFWELPHTWRPASGSFISWLPAALTSSPHQPPLSPDVGSNPGEQSLCCVPLIQHMKGKLSPLRISSNKQRKSSTVLNSVLFEELARCASLAVCISSGRTGPGAVAGGSVVCVGGVPGGVFPIFLRAQ